ncbi:hypothetical protein AWI30_19675 [Enterobacter hormaechei subsp. oharae]|nr:hypothetical protein AWI30_19675 [Enterobacter hormaechei subsp. oharae]
MAELLLGVNIDHIATLRNARGTAYPDPVQAGVQRLTQDAYVAVGDVATIFTQVNGNAVGASLLGDKRRLNRIGIRGTACIT